MLITRVCVEWLQINICVCPAQPLTSDLTVHNPHAVAKIESSLLSIKESMYLFGMFAVDRFEWGLSQY